ncbi:hypothetical protein CALVIDRAFT_596920 [Calocera viscosa TUFC12733]|uniref:F-box domain-containing protein n=1 Tax=Calocera viscosa (strain TUFC12733) TaxID=1330018 RepID=A0A167P448_CALVF|nr:hypothetical protein CALVIDRAFT_596920 [Calocera viscosa TUFC12733]
MAPVHPLLAAPEIVRLISENLNSSSLSAFARSRRALMEIASQQLYKTLDSQQLEKLAVRLLSYVPAPEPGANARVDRFRQMYAQHVLHISIGTFSSHTKQKEVSTWRHLQRLMMIWPTETLFPNLRSLKCTADEPEQVETILKLLVMPLEELFVTGSSLPIVLEQDWNVPVTFLLAALPERCPHLRKLGLNIQATSLDHVGSFERAFSLLTNLTLLECDYIAYHPSVFSRIADLPNLKRLRIGWSAEFLWPEFGSPLSDGEPHFTCMKSLSLEGSSTVLQEAFASIRCDLVELDVGITLTKSAEHHALTSLAADIHSYYPNLRTLQCRVMDASEQDEEGPHHPALLGSFLRCRHITCFGFCYSTTHSDQDQLLHFGNEDIGAIALAWPNLTELRIDCPLADPMALTIDCLGDLAKHCKALTSIELPMLCADDVAAPPCKGSYEQTISLTLKLSSYSNASTVALFLSALWPNIQFGHSCQYCVQIKTLHEMLGYCKIMERYEIGQIPKSAIAHLSPRYRVPFLITP